VVGGYEKAFRTGWSGGGFLTFRGLDGETCMLAISQCVRGMKGVGLQGLDERYMRDDATI
jgi:hypothetical protein